MSEVIKILKRSLKENGIYSHTYKLTNVNQNAGRIKAEQKHRALKIKRGEGVQHVTIGKSDDYAYLFTENVDKGKLEGDLKSAGFKVSWNGSCGMGLVVYLTTDAWDKAVKKQMYLKSRLLDSFDGMSVLYEHMQNTKSLKSEFYELVNHRKLDIFKFNADMREFIGWVEKSYDEHRLDKILKIAGIKAQYVLTIKHALSPLRENWDVIERVVKDNTKKLLHLRDINARLYANEYQVPRDEADKFIAGIPDKYIKYVDTDAIYSDYVSFITLNSNEWPYGKIVLYTEYREGLENETI